MLQIKALRQKGRMPPRLIRRLDAAEERFLSYRTQQRILEELGEYPRAVGKLQKV